MRRSFSSSSLEFKPIKLKSLQEARNEKKSLSTRKFSLNPNDLSSISKTEKSPHSKISPSKPLIKPVFRNPLSSLSKQIHKKTKSVISNPSPINSRQPSSTSATSITSSAKISPNLDLCRQKLIKNQSNSQSSPRKPAIKSKTSSKPAQSSPSRRLFQSKNIPILNLLSGKNKKLTKGQEQGLISRLQGKSIIKFNKLS